MRYRTQAVAYPYFVVAMLLYGLQMVFGLLSAAKYLGPDPLMSLLPFDVTKAIHTNLLVVWEKYLAPQFAHLVPAHAFMLAVGIIEIVAGIGVLFTPWTKVFATIVGLWLLGIALNLILGGFYDIAVRDIVMAASSFCLARLTAPAAARRRAQVAAPA